MTPIGNIITAKYSFNGFVTVFQERLKLENELKLFPTSTDTHFTNNGTYYQRYGRPPGLYRSMVKLLQLPILVALLRPGPSLKAVTRASATSASRVVILGISVGRGLSIAIFQTASRMEMLPFILFLISSLELREIWRRMLWLLISKNERQATITFTLATRKVNLHFSKKVYVRVLTGARHLSNKLTKNGSLTIFLHHSAHLKPFGGALLGFCRGRRSAKPQERHPLKWFMSHRTTHPRRMKCMDISAKSFFVSKRQRR